MPVHDTKTPLVFLPADDESSWSLLPSLVSLLSSGTVQPENTYSHILKVTGQVWESQKWININTNYSYHQLSSPSASLSWSKNGARFSFNQTNRKRWGTKLVNVNYLPHKVFLSWHDKKNKKKNEFKWLNQHHVTKICNENSFTLWKQTVFDSSTMEPVVSTHFKISWLSWGSHVLVLHDGQHPKETWNWVHWSKCVIIFMFLLKGMYVCVLFNKNIQ